MLTVRLLKANIGEREKVPYFSSTLDIHAEEWFSKRVGCLEMCGDQVSGFFGGRSSDIMIRRHCWYLTGGSQGW